MKSLSNFLWQINLENQTRAFVVADSRVSEDRVFALAISLGLGTVLVVKKIGPIMAHMGDTSLHVSPDLSEIIRLCRD